MSSELWKQFRMARSDAAVVRKEKSLMGASQTFDGNLHGFFMPCTLSSDHDVCGA